MPMTYGMIRYGGRPYAKEWRLMKAMGCLHRRIVEPHCGIRVIRKVMVLS